MASIGCVVLSMGNRPAELDTALRSLLSQQGVVLDVVVVGNGWQPFGLPAGVRSVGLASNVGVPEGRNVGAREARGDVLLFFDDDAEWPSTDVLAAVSRRFDDDPRLGVLQPRAVDPAGRRTSRRHIPRLRTADPTRPGDVGWFWEGCSFVRRACFEQAGGWPGHFFYGHESIEVAWRAVDRGWRVAYAADLVVLNPEAPAFSGPERQFTNARNRVWVARRNLPHPLLELYLLVWAAITFTRAARSPGAAVTAGRGFVAGFRQPAGERRPISWRGAWRLTRVGRPPII